MPETPDLVIIQLGTNDSKPYNWRYGTNYVADYEELIASYTSLSNAPQVILCPPVRSMVRERSTFDRAQSQPTSRRPCANSPRNSGLA